MYDNKKACKQGKVDSIIIAQARIRINPLFYSMKTHNESNPNPKKEILIILVWVCVSQSRTVLSL